MPHLKKTLITGTDNGLGAYLKEIYPRATSLGRSTDFTTIANQEYDVIIHCAFNKVNKLDTHSAGSYLDDNLFLTQKLTELSCKKFILISSVDVYPDNDLKHREEENIQLEEIHSLYGLMKSFQESLVLKNIEKPLILRATSLLGKNRMQNNLNAIVTQKNPKVTLTEDSELNFLLYEDMEKIFKQAVKENISGIFNVGATSNISLKSLGRYFNKEIYFGNHKYKVGDIQVSKYNQTFPTLIKTSLQCLDQFLLQNVRPQLAKVA